MLTISQKTHLQEDIFIKKLIDKDVISMEKFILASASPRRRELLEQIGLKFDILTAPIDESGIDKDMSPDLYTGVLAMYKAAASARVLREQGRTKEIVIAADTIVYSDGKILGKPSDKEDAKKILKSLSNKEHEVYTGLCVMRIKDGYSVSRSVRTTVSFKELSDSQIDAYIRTEEPDDKAGAYAIQGKASAFVKGISGDYFNVVGLPLSELYDILKDEFNIEIFNEE